MTVLYVSHVSLESASLCCLYDQETQHLNLPPNALDDLLDRLGGLKKVDVYFWVGPRWVAVHSECKHVYTVGSM